jgi:berberine-like enzyme
MLDFQIKGPEEERVQYSDHIGIATQHMLPFSDNMSFRNYASPFDSDGDHVARYFGAQNVDRLVQIKNDYDPIDLFRHPLSIPLHR